MGPLDSYGSRSGAPAAPPSCGVCRFEAPVPENSEVCQTPDAKGVRKGGVGVKPATLSWIFYKSLLPAQRKLNVFAYFLLVNLQT